LESFFATFTAQCTTQIDMTIVVPIPVSFVYMAVK